MCPLPLYGCQKDEGSAGMPLGEPMSSKPGESPELTNKSSLRTKEGGSVTTPEVADGQSMLSASVLADATATRTQQRYAHMVQASKLVR